MTSKEIFPADVREVLDYMEHGNVLKGSYRSITHGGSMNGTVSETHDPFANLEEALLFYQNEDVEPPYYFLLDITADALGDIPPATGEQGKSLARGLILYEEEQDFYSMMKKNWRDRPKNFV